MSTDEANISSEQQQIVDFVDQGQRVDDNTLAHNIPIQPSYLEMAMHDKHHSLENFLQRPVRIYSGKFTTSMDAGYPIATIRLPDQLLLNKMYNQKISGFVGLRSDVEIRIQVNAQKFQQGRLRLQYIPYSKYLPVKTELLNTNLTTRTSCPGVDLDICGGSTPETRIAQSVLKIPYVSPHLYFNLINGDGTMGDLNLIVYSKLVSGTSEATDCEITMWARFVNPKLQFPTGAKSRYQAAQVCKIPTRHRAQVLGELREIKKTGVISNTLGKISETLKAASGLPIIGKYMAVPEWLSDKARDIAKLFGFSKPTSVMETKLRTTNCFSNFNGKDNSHKLALSATNEIDTPPELFGTQIDEMALSTLSSTPAFWQSFAWSTAVSEADQILYVDPVTPYKFYKNSGVDYSVLPVGYVSNIFGLWRGSLVYTFKFVKTGFHTGRLRIFYSPYEKLENLQVGKTPNNEIEKNYSMIVDLEESDSVTFTVPFVSTKPWVTMTQQESAAIPVPTNTGYVVVTILNELRAVSSVASSIEVLVEVAGGTDLCFAAPGSSRLQPFTFTEQTPSAEVVTNKLEYDYGVINKQLLKDHKLLHEPKRQKPQVSGFDIEPKRQKAQVLGTDVPLNREDAQAQYSVPSLSALDPIENWSPEAHCIGEKIVSCRQLLKRNNYIGTFDTDFIGTTGGSATNNLNMFAAINPYGNKISDLRSGIDYVSYFSMVYAFFRGGMRIKCDCKKLSLVGDRTAATNPSYFVQDGHNVTFKVRMYNAHDKEYGAIRRFTRRINNVLGKIGINPFSSTQEVSLVTDATSTALVVQQIEGLTEFEVPYYNSTHLSPSIVVKPTIVDKKDETQIFPGTSGSDDSYPLPIVLVGESMRVMGQSQQIGESTLTYSPLSTLVVDFYRSAADDYSLSYFMGIPPMVPGDTNEGQVFRPD